MSGPDTGRVDVEVDGPVALLRFSNPPEGFMDEGTEAGLAAAVARVEDDPAIRVAVLTGRDAGVFIRHYDVRLLEARGRMLAAKGYQFRVERPVPETGFHATLRRIEASPKPYLAAINGACMGGGYELALACDLRMAEAGDYPIGLPEANIGLLPGAGGTQRLPRLIGEARALELMLTGRTLRPDEAARIGLVGSVVAAPVLDHALGAARAMAEKPAATLAHIKRLVRGAAAEAARLADERTLFCDLMVSDGAIALMARMNQGAGDITAV